MSYLRYKETFGEILIDLDDIRFIQAISRNPSGGYPRNDSGKITYIDGFFLEVSRECAIAVQNAFKSQTVPTQGKEPSNG